MVGKIGTLSGDILGIPTNTGQTRAASSISVPGLLDSLICSRWQHGIPIVQMRKLKLKAFMTYQDDRSQWLRSSVRAGLSDCKIWPHFSILLSVTLSLPSHHPGGLAVPQPSPGSSLEPSYLLLLMPDCLSLRSHTCHSIPTFMTQHNITFSVRPSASVTPHLLPFLAFLHQTYHHLT